jgi:hypothetical protein
MSSNIEIIFSILFLTIAIGGIVKYNLYKFKKKLKKITNIEKITNYETPIAILFLL